MELKKDVTSNQKIANEYIAMAISLHLFSDNDVKEIIDHEDGIFGAVKYIDKALRETLALPNLGRRAIILEGNFEEFYDYD